MLVAYLLGIKRIYLQTILDYRRIHVVNTGYLYFQQSNSQFKIFNCISDTDLHNVVKRGNILKDIHKRYIMYQLFKGMHYMHSGNVIHRDQKVRFFSSS